MVLSFKVRRGIPIPGGELGVPRSGMLGPKTAERLGGDTLRRAIKRKPPVLANESFLSMPER
jgi:hypothetical protein